MKQVALCLGLLLISVVVQAKDLVITIDGKEVKMDCTVISHEITASDQDKGNQTNAMACSFLVYNLLSHGDIQEASKLSADPAKTAEKWTKYQDRVGAEDFKKNMRDYFTSKNVIMAELVLGDDTMLVVKTAEYTGGQFYQKKNGKYLMTDEPTAGETLGQVLNMIKDGKLKL